ncbi:hypothetical protein OGH69_11385 [Flavobacterium sp. MFBS3-15]|uniref:hypothetical protein n=1 Tax=Flavobacterium sp. MFBS3-15 TaxID=2989816 RepID=UPI002235F6AB|nr:hypothetical protein [Flavobacterium sp. MFBS3-15]MCW4469571.1 hypothetical protein [Flavobacterium sp. MFBS3-15]
MDKLGSRFTHFCKDPYFYYDRLENVSDLESLYEVLASVKDSNGRPAILTANTIVANPNFEAIQKSAYSDYSYELFTDTLKKRDGNLHVFDTIKEGMAAKVYRPQLHGREHLNVNQWLKGLNEGHTELLAAFEHHMFGVPLNQRINMRRNVMAALDFNDNHEINLHRDILFAAQNHFEELFGFRSITFIAPSYIWHPTHEQFLQDMGILGIQGLPYQYIPNPGGTWYKKKFRYTKREKDNPVALVRNAFFEPSLDDTGKDTVAECLRRISIAFTMKKPAIIGSHRLNYIGSLSEKNREHTLTLLRQLLKEIVTRWPSVEFVSSDELTRLIKYKIQF